MKNLNRVFCSFKLQVFDVGILLDMYPRNSSNQFRIESYFEISLTERDLFLDLFPDLFLERSAQSFRKINLIENLEILFKSQHSLSL